MKIRLIFLAILVSSNLFAHKFYVSITELEYNAEKKQIEGSLKIIAHDFEQMLSEKYAKKIDLENVADSSEVGQYVQSYLVSHFKLFSSGKQLQPNYIGKEITVRQELFLYFTIQNIDNPKEIKLVNTILFGFFPLQQNIVHYKFKKQTKSLTLVPSKTHGIIKFD